MLPGEKLPHGDGNSVGYNGYAEGIVDEESHQGEAGHSWRRHSKQEAGQKKGEDDSPQGDVMNRWDIEILVEIKDFREYGTDYQDDQLWGEGKASSQCLRFDKDLGQDEGQDSDEGDDESGRVEVGDSHEEVIHLLKGRRSSMKRNRLT